MINQPPEIAPTIVRVGDMLTATSLGSWQPEQGVTVSYQWLRCPDGGACVPTGAETVLLPLPYIIADADRGHSLQLRLTVRRGNQSTSAESMPTAIVPLAPSNTKPPALTGNAIEGELLTASTGDWRGSPPPQFVYTWQRCRSGDCKAIDGADGATYMLSAADVGATILVVITASNAEGSATASSEPKGPVQRAPLEPPSFTQSGTTVLAPRAAFMRPFPRVRFKGYVTATGAVLQLVTVRGPARARIALRCRGPSCPFRRRTRRARSLVRLRSLERSYLAGARLTIRVTKPGLIGKYVRLIIRAKRVPLRRDRCLLPGARRPVACPAPD